MKKIRAAIVGYGNIGSYVLEALQAVPDFEVAGVVRRDATNVPAELKDYVVVSDIAQIKDVDVAILCTPTRSVESYASKILAMGINTVDSFDIHTEISGLHKRLGEVAKKHGKVSVISAGWDPGSDGTHGCSESRGRRESCVIHDDSGGNGNPSPDGVRGVERGVRFQTSGRGDQDRSLFRA